MAMELIEEWTRAVRIDPSKSIVETSAKNNENVPTIFRKLYEQAVCINGTTTSSTLSTNQKQSANHIDDNQLLQQPQVDSRSTSQDPFLKRHFSAKATKRGESSSTGLTPDTAAVNGGAGLKAEPGVSRSRSLIRRVRKPKVKDAVDPNINDCVLS